MLMHVLMYSVHRLMYMQLFNELMAPAIDFNLCMHSNQSIVTQSS